MQFNTYSQAGRMLMIKFTCTRCGKEHIDPLEKHKNDGAEHYGHLQFIKPPAGWEELGHGPLLCDECVQAYKDFMRFGRIKKL